MKGLKVGFIGAGSIAESILTGLVDTNKINSENVAIINKSNHAKLAELRERFQLSMYANQEESILNSDVVILAVKPKAIHEVLDYWGRKFQKGQVLISVVAGVTTKQIEQACSCPISVIRSMPNTSSAVGRSATAICSGKYVSRLDLYLAKMIFEAIGTVTVVQEEQMDAVTGLSGSGPAYVYYMVEALQEAGSRVGLEPETARQLIIQTCIGAAEMLNYTGKEPSRLRKEVTSEGGTTFAGLTVLCNKGFESALIEAVIRATERSKELGNNL